MLAPVVYTSGFYINAPYVTTPAQVDSAVLAQKRAGYDVLKLHGDLPADAYRRLMKSAHREGMRLIGHAPRNLGFETMIAERQDVIAHAVEFLYGFFLFRRSPRLGRRDRQHDSLRRRGDRESRIWLMPTLTCFRNISGQIENLDSVLALPSHAVHTRGLAPTGTGSESVCQEPALRGPPQFAAAIPSLRA